MKTLFYGGTVVDGTGRPRYDADVLVDNGIITAIGAIEPAGPVLPGVPHAGPSRRFFLALAIVPFDENLQRIGPAAVWLLIPGPVAGVLGFLIATRPRR